MTKGLHKKPSKRIPAKRRYKIEKKVREHNRKLRKELKKNSNNHRKRKDPGIPNSLPFKEEVLQDIQEHKKRSEEIKDSLKAQLKLNRQAKREKLLNKNRNLEIEELLKNAEKRGAEFNNRTKLEEYVVVATADDECSNAKSFYKDVQNVIEASDIIIEVVDARDPLGTRCLEMEDAIKKKYPEKRLILLINKCDLIPKENLKKWINYFRSDFITVPFKACTQNQRQNLSSSKVKILLSPDELLRSSKCLGMDFLMKIINNYCHNKNIKSSVTIGIIGFPNVGKSSVINSLKRSYVCSVGPTPGITRTMQTVALDKKIKLVDSPGIVFAKNRTGDQEGSPMSAILALRNAVNIDKLEDPILPVEAILNRVRTEDLMKIYRLVEFSGVQQFLGLVAKRFGKMLKGGRLDLNGAARKVLHDWNSGKLRYFTVPPETSTATATDDVQIVESLSKEFDVNEFVYKEMMAIDMESAGDDDSMMNSSNSIPIQISAPAAMHEIQMEEEEEEEKKEEKGNRASHRDDVEMIVEEEVAGMQLNKNVKQQFKKMKKRQKKETKLSKQLEEINLEEDYDFDSYF